MKKKEENIKKIEDVLIQTGIEVARKGEGALFIISDKCKYKKLLKQKIESFSIFEKGARKLLLSIAMIDGAVILNPEGMLIQYGARVESKGIFQGYGTRHAAAYSASKNPDTIAVLVSQEEKKIKIFKKGKVIIQIDALQKNVEKQVSEFNEILESVGIGTISTLGVTALAPALGVAIVPGIILFGAPYYLIKKLSSRNK